MGKRNDCWGIEVGANAIKAIRLQRVKDKIILADFEVLPFKKPLTTPDLNINEAIQVNLDQFLSKHSVARSTVMTSVPGHMAFARFAKLPPVDPKRIPDIVRFEAVQQIPFPIEQVEWDYQVFQEPDNPDVEVGIFAITKDRVADFLENYNAVGMRVDGITLSPLAVYNALAYDLELDEESPGVVFMDIGSTSTDVVIVEAGHLWMRTLPVGGNNFTDALVRAFKLSVPKAEKLKREASTSKYARQIFQAMRPVFADLVQEMQRSLGFYQSLNRDAKLAKLIGVGSTFRLPGMSKFLKQQLQMDVVRLDSLQNVQMEGRLETEFAEHTMNMATAYGLALQGLEAEQVSANLLTKEIQRNRFWRAKQPMMGAAALLMVAASVGAVGKLMTDKASFSSALEESSPKIKNVTKRAEDFKRKWGEIEHSSDPRQLIENLRRVLDYRDIWPKLIWDMDLVAQDMKSQPQLWTNDYDKIKAVPRQERRRLYFDKLEAEYVFSPGRTDIASMRTEDIWKLGEGEGEDGAPPPPVQQEDPMGMGMPGMPGMEGMGGFGMPPSGGGFNMPVAGVGGSLYSSSNAGAIAPPRFRITVSGTTPYRGGAQFITRNFMNWLRKHADRSDRPYRIIKNSPDLVQLESIQNSGNTGNNNPNESRTRRALNQPQPRSTRIRRRTPIGGDMPGEGGMQLGARTETKSTLDLTTILPDRPLSDESENGDYRFTVVWTIELTRPDNARRSEDKIRRERVAKREAMEKARIQEEARKAAEALKKQSEEQKAAESEGSKPASDKTVAPDATPTTGGDQ
ncbi:type IV pilus assembly protein PilM [bacterium AH-315-I18]|nr:type IV pilus assembly protein PilM [Phycisphaeraceae bacterium]MBN4060813.1 type IV pilus assembly protein PilM [bacterium AH-315-I18]